jgi:hypothetical protein
MLFDPNLGFIPGLRRDVEIWHVFEVKDSFFAQTVLALNNYCPKDLA